MITNAHDPMYEVKRWLYWHSPLGIHQPTVYELERQAEAERREKEYKPGLMERFTTKLVHALRKELEELREAGKLSGKAHTNHLEMLRAYTVRMNYYIEHHL